VRPVLNRRSLSGIRHDTFVARLAVENSFVKARSSPVSKLQRMLL
jgi:hypothetical protein